VHDSNVYVVCTLVYSTLVKVVMFFFYKIVIRSDVAGQLLPLFGKDWSQFGVVSWCIG